MIDFKIFDAAAFWSFFVRVLGFLKRLIYVAYSTFRRVIWFFKQLMYIIRSSWEMIVVLFKHLLYALVFPCLVVAALLKRKPGRARGAKRILMLTISQIEIDPRINKVARSLARQGYEISIICFRGSAKTPKMESPYPGVVYRRVPIGAIWIQWQIYFQLSMLRAGMAERCDIVYANDLTTLLVGWMLSRFKGVPLVYDAHEVWTENVEYDNARKEYVPIKAWKKCLLTRMEGAILHNGVNLFMSVSSTICAEYKMRYRLPFDPLTLPNFPELALLNEQGVVDTRVQCGLSKEHFMILYLGGVGPARNIENVILALPFLPEKCVFVIQGPAIDEYRGEYLELAGSKGVADRVFCLGPVGKDQVIAASSFADCGILMLRNICLNFYLYYPNKFFEYMLAGIPVAVSNFPEVSAHVARESCGVTFDPDDPKSIANALLWLYEHPDERAEMGARGRRSVMEKYHWEETVKQLYAGLAGLSQES